MKVQRFFYGFLNHRNAKISSKKINILFLWNMLELKKINLISITEKNLHWPNTKTYLLILNLQFPVVL